MDNKSTIVRTMNVVAPVASTVAPGLAARWLGRLFITPRRWPMPSRERPWIESALRSTVRVEGRALAVYTWGRGPVVLLVHGWSGRASQLGVYAEPLVKRGFRVVAFDGPAHGSSEGRTSALPELARAIERVARRAGPLHAIIGHSLGTAATSLAVHRGVEVERLIYIAPPENPGCFLGQAARALGFSEAVGRRTRVRLERRFGVSFEDARGSTLAADIARPLLVIHDAQDAEVPHAEGERLVRAWPGARLMTVEGLGHRRILRDEAVVRAVVDFVGSSAGAVVSRPAAHPA